MRSDRWAGFVGCFPTAPPRGDIQPGGRARPRARRHSERLTLRDPWRITGGGPPPPASTPELYGEWLASFGMMKDDEGNEYRVLSPSDIGDET